MPGTGISFLGMGLLRTGERNFRPELKGLTAAERKKLRTRWGDHADRAGGAAGAGDRGTAANPRDRLWIGRPRHDILRLVAQADPALPSTSPAGGKIVCFQLGEQIFGLPICAVKETIAPRPLTRLPLCPDFLLGLLNLRGDVVAVLDLGRLLKLGEDGAPVLAAPAEQRRIVLLRSRGRAAGHGAACGLLVDRLLAPQRMARDEVRPVPGAWADSVTACLAGVARLSDGTDGTPGERPLLLIDPARLLDTPQLRPFRRREGAAGAGAA